MLPITCELAQRLEATEGLDGVACAEALARLDPQAGAAAKPIAGGFIVFSGTDSPLTRSIGIGMHGPVTGAELDEIEDFFVSRNAAVTIDVCPYADPTLLELLGGRHYRPIDFSNVMVRGISTTETLPEAQNVSTRNALSNERDVWARTVVCGFMSRLAVTPEELNMGEIIFGMPRSEPVFAMVGDKFAGAGSATYREGVASFFADATMVRYRRQGVHRELIRKRLETAVSRGSEYATCAVVPGGASQRNYEAAGFQVAFTKVTMTRE